ncbi:rho GTPase-activating protein 22-like [Hippocampus zosterae]|uniref:rho GTPase-activating protein 22-like n=1 Tax=Hippocampus zosterae TaxID=109293 RepID=UPI00223CA2D8|nr:rho GTPase-activating protein 22-like [Hippocampus zosterae]
MESSFQEHFHDHMWAPEMGTDEQSDPWSESSSDTQNQEIGNELEPDTDYVSCGFVERNQMLQLQQSSSPQPHRQGSWTQNEVQHPQETQWAPKVPPPLPLADPSASALRSLLTNLQQQIVRQHEVYEARILSLEERNKELQAEVVLLKTNLLRQRHWYQAVQEKITQSERERAAAERRNSALQEDMEQFFDTFGDLNNEVKKTERIIGSF